MVNKISSLPVVLWIGLLAGTLDITDNLIFNEFRGISPRMVFQYIASGLIGRRAFQGGLGSVALGVILHYAIALIWTGIFYLASRRVLIAVRRPIVSGLLYGCIIYLIMNLVLLPLSGVPHPRNAITLASRVNGVLALMFCVGLPVALLVRRYLPVRKS